MVFSSPEFLFMYLPLVLVLYYAVPARHRQFRNVVLLVVSLFFYGWGGKPAYVLLMVGTIVADWFFGYMVDKYRGDDKKAKAWLVASVVFNIGLLGFFKYFDFIVSNLALIPGLSWMKPLGITLPLGISFYTFQAMSYVIDVYRRDTPVQKNVASFGTYVTLFPQLIAGPIVRYRDVDDQLGDREETVTLFASGVRTFIAGLGKKVILGNAACEVWELLASVPAGEKTVLGAWLGIIFYTFHIYYDFSGYSDMAIGLGKMFGFRFLENFNYPYIAKSITDFWRRWHMSLSTWFREYVYFPLGGSRCSVWKNYRNLFAVWLLTGIWHGANWNYVLWGLYYFLLLVVEKAFLGKLLEKAPAVLRHIYTLFFVAIGWLLFVSTDMSAGFTYLGNLFGVGVTGAGGGYTVYDLVRSIPFLVILTIAATPLPKKLFYRLYEKSRGMRTAAMCGTAVLLLLVTACLISSSYNPFIYWIF